MSPTGGERGSISVEMAILAPAFALLFSLVVFAGRVQSTRADIEAAAHGAARSITLSRDPAATVVDAERATRTRLDVGSRSCRTMGWDVQLTDTDVTVALSCEIDMADAAFLPIPGTFEVDATASEVLDRHIEGR